MDFYPLSDLHHRTVRLVEACDSDAYGRTVVSRDCRDGAWFTAHDRTQQQGGEDQESEPLAASCRPVKRHGISEVIRRLELQMERIYE